MRSWRRACCSHTRRDESQQPLLRPCGRSGRRLHVKTARHHAHLSLEACWKRALYMARSAPRCMSKSGGHAGASDG